MMTDRLVFRNATDFDKGGCEGSGAIAHLVFFVFVVVVNPFFRKRCFFNISLLFCLMVFESVCIPLVVGLLWTLSFFLLREKASNVNRQLLTYFRILFCFYSSTILTVTASSTVHFKSRHDALTLAFSKFL